MEIAIWFSGIQINKIFPNTAVINFDNGNSMQNDEVTAGSIVSFDQEIINTYKGNETKTKMYISVKVSTVAKDHVICEIEYDRYRLEENQKARFYIEPSYKLKKLHTVDPSP